MIGYEEIVRRIGFHPSTPATVPVYEENRRRFIELAEYVDGLPAGREVALALTALQEALMWANAAVACEA